VLGVAVLERSRQTPDELLSRLRSSASTIRARDRNDPTEL
jgi:hypothetical protein